MSKEGKKVVTKQGSAIDKLKWLVALLLLAVGFVANYQFNQVPGALRAVGWLVLIAVVTFILLQTLVGKEFWRFAKAARDEVKRVVWPTRQETLQTTGVVILVVLVLALILWGVDSVLLAGISWFTGHGG